MRASQVPQLLSSARCLSTGTEAPHIYDVAIVGGGMVGMSLAAALGASEVTSGQTADAGSPRTQRARLVQEPSRRQAGCV